MPLLLLFVVNASCDIVIADEEVVNDDVDDTDELMIFVATIFSIFGFIISICWSWFCIRLTCIKSMVPLSLLNLTKINEFMSSSLYGCDSILILLIMS